MKINMENIDCKINEQQNQLFPQNKIIVPHILQKNYLEWSPKKSEQVELSCSPRGAVSVFPSSLTTSCAPSEFSGNHCSEVHKSEPALHTPHFIVAYLHILFSFQVFISVLKFAVCACLCVWMDGNTKIFLSTFLFF